MLKKWQTKSEKAVGNFKIFDLYSVQRANSEDTKSGEFYYLDSPEWVNILPITKDNKIVFVEQYRHGSDSITLELPAGLIEKGEAPRIAAMRECTEETGFTSSNEPELLGTILPNPAFMNNKCYAYLWRDCERQFAQNLDANEEIEVHLLDFEAVKRKIQNGEINHSLVLCNFLYFSIKYGF